MFVTIGSSENQTQMFAEFNDEISSKLKISICGQRVYSLNFTGDGTLNSNEFSLD